MPTNLKLNQPKKPSGAGTVEGGAVEGAGVLTTPRPTMLPLTTVHLATVSSPTLPMLNSLSSPENLVLVTLSQMRALPSLPTVTMPVMPVMTSTY